MPSFEIANCVHGFVQLICAVYDGFDAPGLNQPAEELQVIAPRLRQERRHGLADERRQQKSPYQATDGPMMRPGESPLLSTRIPLAVSTRRKDPGGVVPPS